MHRPSPHLNIQGSHSLFSHWSSSLPSLQSYYNDIERCQSWFSFNLPEAQSSKPLNSLLTCSLSQTQDDGMHWWVDLHVNSSALQVTDVSLWQFCSSEPSWQSSSPSENGKCFWKRSQLNLNSIRTYRISKYYWCNGRFCIGTLLAYIPWMNNSLRRFRLDSLDLNKW